MNKKRRKPFIILIAAFVIVNFLLIISVSNLLATPIFYLSPGIDPSGDQNFQNAIIGYDFYEEDFNGYANRSVINSLNLGGVNVDVSLPDNGSPGAEIFWGSYAEAGGVYGTVSGGALANVNRPSGYLESDTFKFSFSGDLVTGFGIWVFDDTRRSADSFSLTIENTDGNTWTSSILDANPGNTDHIVEGFFGVTLSSGISSATINNIGSNTEYFELDHLQIASAPVPEPSTMILLGTGLIGLAGWGRRKFRK